ncbi:MAG: 50S ribosomal protein L37e [Candidatus Korarchaeota archaeon]|nr:50S ribosomal protein L37e [Candidatus Korarchaeota archaeon]NIU85051.1 50S ribosomal protein L37e [Candidatus Thorarchaeota archaeon]NIW15191.1 50S ribosomal protein L37e [Candidatus Thorarchaeota archaeon]NIW53103.1 50S ribosomal protein L37e [Candidatus Korarchaeota archaeon]
MTKGTPSQGKKSKKKTHVICRRCGKQSFNTQGYCAACGFGKSAKRRNYNWHRPKQKGRRD